MIWNPNKECMSRDEMSALQGKRLNKIVTYVYHNVPFYRHKLQELDIRPDDIQTIEDIKRLPFTTKQDLRDNYPFGLQAAPRSEIIRVHASSGTTGNPTIVGYTRKDIGVWSECMARCLTAYGITRNDTFSVSYGYGLFTGGLGAHYGVEHLGASVVPASTGNTEKHLKLIRDLGVTGIACTPSYALYLAETMDRLGITKDQIKLRVGAFGAEPWTEGMRKELEDKLVDKKDINTAISLALKCPSACNRQVTNCYVYQSKELQTIILTTSIRAYGSGEFNDWFVSPSIFAGYLSLSLHLYGIGSCIYRKQLYGHHPYNEEMRKKCNIPSDEMIVLELRIGYYKNEFKVAVSNRHNADDITKYVEE